MRLKCQLFHPKSHQRICTTSIDLTQFQQNANRLDSKLQFGMISMRLHEKDNSMNRVFTLSEKSMVRFLRTWSHFFIQSFYQLIFLLLFQILGDVFDGFDGSKTTSLFPTIDFFLYYRKYLNRTFVNLFSECYLFKKKS